MFKFVFFFFITFHNSQGDFGVSKIINKNNADTFNLVDTPLHIAPEIIREEKLYSWETDMWALGVLLYYMMYLKYPFTANNLAFLALNIVSKEVEYPIEKVYSQELKNILKYLLSKVCYIHKLINFLFKLIIFL
jgi:NIMA (never in mitosis gene a)-related kinase